MNAQRPRILPLLYLGTAHVALALACALAILWPRSVAGFFYHSWLVALVHLVTLGWLTMSIFGGFYLVGPMLTNGGVVVRRADYVAYIAAVIGLIGMVAHFWIEQFSGMAWSAGTIGGAALYVTGRIAACVVAARLHPGVRLFIVSACANFWIAAGMGLLLAIHKAVPFLPGYILTNVFAHAHLAAVGWATMLVLGVVAGWSASAQPPRAPIGPGLSASAVLIEAGVLGLFVTLLLQSAWSALCGAMIVAGLLVFGLSMLKAGSPAKAGPCRASSASRFDFTIAHTVSAALCLSMAAALGLVLLVMPQSDLSLRIAAGYGVLGLLGFLAQMIVAFETPLLPLARRWWMTPDGDGGDVAPEDGRRDATLQALVLAGWTIGICGLTLGLGRDSSRLIVIGGAALFTAVVAAAVDHVSVLVATASDAARARTVDPQPARRP